MSLTSISATSLDGPAGSNAVDGLAEPLAGSVGSAGGSVEPGEAGLSAQAIDQISALGGAELSAVKAALGAITGDPMAVAASLPPSIRALAKGEDLFAAGVSREAGS